MAWFDCVLHCMLTLQNGLKKKPIEASRIKIKSFKKDLNDITLITIRLPYVMLVPKNSCNLSSTAFLLPPFLTDKYAVRFIPRENGLYLIDVKFNGSHIPGSPFKIRVGETGQAGDPGMVSAYGAGLEGGTTGTKSFRYHV